MLSQLLNLLSKLRHRATLPTPVADGGVADLVGDAFGRLVTVGPQSSGRYVVPALTYKGRVVAEAAQLLELSAFNDGADPVYLMLFDSYSLTAPADGTTPIERFLVPAGGTLGFVPDYPLAFASGIYWAVSSTASTLTIDAAATLHVSATYGS
jgi:hypothetical protein